MSSPNTLAGKAAPVQAATQEDAQVNMLSDAPSWPHVQSSDIQSLTEAI
ncbi:MAG: hypothetical protein IT547_08310 [Hyphomonadaceae bacterium]|nr:hypothetical protein [Hyphomonadaceae bacterium]